MLLMLLFISFFSLFPKAPLHSLQCVNNLEQLAQKHFSALTDCNVIVVEDVMNEASRGVASPSVQWDTLLRVRVLLLNANVLTQ